MANKRQPPPVLSAADQAIAAKVILGCITDAVSYYFWHYHAKPALKEKFEMDVIASWQNSETMATILTIRALDDFLANRRRFSDDLTADQLPFLSPTAGILNQSERDYIGKHLAHITTEKFKPNPPFEYRDFLRRLHPIAVKICEEMAVWADSFDADLAVFARHQREILDGVHSDYVLKVNA